MSPTATVKPSRTAPHYGGAAHEEFDAWLWKTRCHCGNYFFVDEWPQLICRTGHRANVVVEADLGVLR